MPVVSFRELMTQAQRGNYAVGYFESWDMQSLLAVADAAEARRSPVILGFSGIYLPHRDRRVRDRLEIYAVMAREVCRGLSVPACLLFNESPDIEWVLQAIDTGFDLVMFTDENANLADQTQQVRRVVAKAHGANVAVEGEIRSLAEVDRPTDLPDLRITDVDMARDFVNQTGIDALAVNIGQIHLHGRRRVHLDFDQLALLRSAVSIPLVLHGATSVVAEDLTQASRSGIRKINVGSVLKQTYFQAMRQAALNAGATYNPYHVIGSGLPEDVHEAGRTAMQKVVENLMDLFGSSGEAWSLHNQNGGRHHGNIRCRTRESEFLRTQVHETGAR